MTLKSLLRHETFLAILLVVVLIILSFQSDKFFTVSNLLNQGRLMTETGLIAIAMTFIIATGGIDLSVGSILGLTAILTGVFWQNVGLPLPLAAAAAIAVGTLAGFVNGVIVTRFRVPPLIATLATLALYRGLAEGISQARSVRGYPEWFYVLGQGEVLGVPTQLWILLGRGRRRLGHPGLHALGPHHLCDRLERGRGALLRPVGGGHETRALHGFGFRRGARRRHLRFARLDDALRHGYRHRSWTRSPPWCSVAPRSSAAAAPSSAPSSGFA
jgi:hypothetical protein